TQEIIHITAVVTVVKRHSGGVYTFILQDDSITLTGAVGCIGMDANRHSGCLAGSGGRPQTHLFKRGRTTSNYPYLDYACLYARAVNASINFLHEIFGKT